MTSQMTSDLYPAAYYEGGGGSNYENYGDDPGWIPTAVVLRNLIEVDDTVLEVGCATGWFVRAAKSLGIDAWGTDISEWAIAHPAPGVEPYLTQSSVLDLPEAFEVCDVVVSWEMLEHVPEDEVPAALAAMKAVTAAGGLWIHRIALDDHSHDHNAEDDVTHFTIKAREWWLEQFAAVGAHRVERIEEMFDEVFAGRDWSGRFFAYRL